MDIVVTGSIAYDYLMRFPGKFKEHLLLDNLKHISVSFLVDKLTRHWGGNGANISYNLAMLGVRPRLMGTAGKDFSDYRTWLDSAGVDTRGVVVIDELFTASFFANTDEDNNQIASFYGGAMFEAKNYTLAQAVQGTPDYVVIAPNAPEAMCQLAQECQSRGIRYMYDPSQQLPRLDKEALFCGLEKAHILTVNEYEWDMLSMKTGLSLKEVTNQGKIVVRTLGKNGAEIFADDKHYEIPVFPLPTEKIIDPTGVGDATRAGILCGLVHNWPWEVTGRVAALCSAYALEKVGTQSHAYTPQEFVARYRTEFDDNGVLDSLIKQTVG
jgi:adenosine kinase